MLYCSLEQHCRRTMQREEQASMVHVLVVETDASIRDT
jgi:hypothetical protein